jgi:MFS family permease
MSPPSTRPNDVSISARYFDTFQEHVDAFDISLRCVDPPCITIGPPYRCHSSSLARINRSRSFSGLITVACVPRLIPVIALTNLARVPLLVALAISTLLMICMSGRFVPAMAMMMATVEARYRGGFMSVNSSVQQFSCGLAAWISGGIIGQGLNQEITHYPVAGLVSLACVLTCIWLARFLRPAPGELTAAPVFAESV